MGNQIKSVGIIGAGQMGGGISSRLRHGRI